MILNCKSVVPLFASFIVPLAIGTAASAQNVVHIRIDATHGQHPISPYIYGVAMGTPQQLSALNCPVNRYGGNNTSRYNWKVNSSNLDNDGFFETPPDHNWPMPDGDDLTPAASMDQLIANNKSAGAASMMTVSMVGWVGKVVDPKTTLHSYSVAKYGPQQRTDPNLPDAGNGRKPDGTRILTNDPNDANVPSDVNFQRGYVQHLVDRWGTASNGGVKLYLMDNEPGIWHETHQDVHPNGATSKEIADDIINYGTMVKSIDPSAKVVGPEEWGYMALASSGSDKQYGEAHGWPTDLPDKTARGGMDNMPWILDYIHKHDVQVGQRTLDYFTIHIYPQQPSAPQTGNDAADLHRNESTRQFWDANYVDGSWIKDKMMVIPRLRAMVKEYYPGTKTGITEYSWGPENTMNGATAQADLLGIFGREGLDLATRWIVPNTDSLVFKAYQLYRNYDGKKSTFGNTSISDIPDSSPDDLSSFAAIRKSDDALTVLVVNKNLYSPHDIAISLNGLGELSHSAQVYQLTSAGQITALNDIALDSTNITATVPAQSITLYVVEKK